MQVATVSYTDRTPIISVKSDNLEYLTTKNIYWQHESERRYIVITLGKSQDRDGEFISGTNYFKFNDHSLDKSEGRIVKAIYFGLNTSLDDKNKIAECIDRANYPIHLLKSCPVPEHYSLEFCQITSREFA